MDDHELLKELRQIKKSLSATRAVCGVCCFLTLTIICALVFVAIRVKPLMEAADKIAPAVDRLSQLDMEKISESVERVSEATSKIDIDKVSEAIGELDVSSINNTIKSLDVEGLNKSISTINNSADTISTIVDKLKDVQSFFR